MEKVEMHVPNKSYDGYYGGVKFTNGVGVFTEVEVAKDLAKRYGYTIVEIKDEEAIEEVKPKAKRKPRAKKVAE